MKLSATVIIPAFNVETCLSNCLESILCQSHPAHEIIVINDGSTDDTAFIAKGYGSRIIYLEQDNAGQGAARNAGLAVATGDFIAFLDADDFWKPKFLQKCLSFLRTNLECVAVNTGLITRMLDGREVVQPELLSRPDAPKRPFVIDDFYVFWAEHDHVRTGSAVIRKNLIDKVGGQRADLRVSQDLEYWGYIATFGKWGYIPEPLWVGNSRVSAAASGWLRKYRERRRLCPTVEAWQERILPRLSSFQLQNFKVIRGRVAAGFAQNHILGGDPAQARQIVMNYGHEMPDNHMTQLYKIGNRVGGLGWWIVCRMVVAREYIKANKIRLFFKANRGCR